MMTVSFEEKISKIDPELLNFRKLETLQVNLGNMCNQYCTHCHIEAGPSGNKIMRRDVMEKIITFLKENSNITLDITGGCPELNPGFRFFLENSYSLVSSVMVRTNLTILLEDKMEWIPKWYRDHNVVLIASLPCYTKENVDRQRGNGSFKKSIKALRKLNALGYGDVYELNLVYNPGGGFLPASQKELEEDYRKKLLDEYGIRFSRLFTITNAPVGRFKNFLKANGKLEEYILLLAQNFNAEAACHIMCRNLINIDWQGILYNCDFNQALGLPVRNDKGGILEIDHIKEVLENKYRVAMSDHCFCCTAGAGSSCTGALA